MKRKLFTKAHNIELLKKVYNNGEQFTAEEHAWTIEQEFAEKYSTRESHLKYSLSLNYNKLGTFPFLVNFIKINNLKNIISLGAGDCSLEYILSFCLGNETKVTATDFDQFFIASASKNFGDIIQVERFDFFQDDFNKLKCRPFDLAIFYGSAYVMDDDIFIKLFNDIKKSGCKYIIDFHSGYITPNEAIKIKIHDLVRKYPKIKYLLSRLLNRGIPNQTKDNFIGKFHGFGRNKSALESLYKKSGWTIISSFCMPKAYKYVSILKNT